MTLTHILQFIDVYDINLRKCFDVKGGYRGFYARNTITLTPSSVNNIHKRGGTILGTSRGGHDTNKIVDSIQDRGINQVCTSFYIPIFFFVCMYIRLINILLNFRFILLEEMELRGVLL
jgi:hypothetical protein